MSGLIALLLITAVFMLLFIAFDSYKAKKSNQKGDKENGRSRR